MYDILFIVFGCCFLGIMLYFAIKYINKNRNKEPDFIVYKEVGILEQTKGQLATTPKSYGDKHLVCPKCHSKRVSIEFNPITSYNVCNDCGYKKVIYYKITY